MAFIVVAVIVVDIVASVTAVVFVDAAVKARIVVADGETNLPVVVLFVVYIITSSS